MTGQFERPSEISQNKWDVVDVPEMTDEEFANAQPFATGFLEACGACNNKGDGPKIAEPKVRIGLRLAADVASAVKASGKNYKAQFALGLHVDSELQSHGGI